LLPPDRPGIGNKLPRRITTNRSLVDPPQNARLRREVETAFRHAGPVAERRLVKRARGMILTLSWIRK
jgi:hypothetical protein